MTSRPDSEQPSLLPEIRATVQEAQAKARATRERKRSEAAITDVLPVARVLVDVGLAHLDRPFDYAVPVAMAEAAQPGVRVKVRFAGQDVDGFVLAREEASEHAGRLQPLRRVVSPEPVLSPAIAAVAGDVVARYAGVTSDVLRLAIPPRHATTEKAEPRQRPAPEPGPAHDVARYPQGPAFLRHLAEGGAPRAVWGLAPGDAWPAVLAEAVAATTRSGRGALVCLPDGKDVALLDAALTARLGAGQHVALTADAGPARRYREFLAVARGQVKVVVGTRAAGWAPVHDLGLVVIWDDGDDLHAEPRAPYPHLREVLLMRAEREGTAALLAGFARSVESDHLVRSGWAHPIDPPRALVRERVTIGVAGASDVDRARDPHGAGARIPRQVHDLLRSALTTGPVLVQTPRAGYALALACDRCRTPAHCSTCHGSLHLTGPTTPPACRWCATSATGWSCPVCAGRGLRAPVVGESRTREELGRAFPNVPVRSSAGDHVLADVPAGPAIVVATPGAEPRAPDGYAAVVLLDCWLLLARDDLRAGEEALRRWANAVALVGPGAQVLAVGDPAAAELQALVRWDHGGYAEREAAARREAHLPPGTRIASIAGDPGALDDALTLLAPSLPAAVEVLGPVPAGEEEERLIVRVPRASGPALSRALLDLQRVRSSRKLDAVRVRVDTVAL